MISFIMPSMNRQPFIRRAVEAIVNQSSNEWELIICESGMGVGHEVIADLVKDNSNITYIHRKDKGITDAINYGMRLSKGELMMWANDDDLVHPDAVSAILESYRGSQPQKMWGFGRILTSDGGEMGYPGQLEDLKLGNFIPQPAVFWSREAYVEVGEMSSENDLVSDYEYWLRLMTKFPDYQFIDKVLANYTIHPDQITKKITSEQMRQANAVRSVYGA